MQSPKSPHTSKRIDSIKMKIEDGLCMEEYSSKGFMIVYFFKVTLFCLNICIWYPWESLQMTLHHRLTSSTKSPSVLKTI